MGRAVLPNEIRHGYASFMPQTFDENLLPQQGPTISFTPTTLRDKDLLSEAYKVVGDVWKNEESRFNNLNTRGAAVLSATSLVTTILGFFSKNLFDGSIKGQYRTAGVVGLDIVFVLLVITAALIVFGVLRPSRRAIFGNNWLTDGGNPKIATTVNKSKNPPEPNATDVSLTGADVVDGTVPVDQLAVNEYGAIFAVLAERSERKAIYLKNSYYSLFASIVISAIAFAIIIVPAPKSSTPSPPALCSSSCQVNVTK
jgi:hypothetical protein